MNQNKLIGWAVVVIVLIGGVFYFSADKKEQGSIKIGALLPLTGKFANLGEDVKNGLELARQDMQNSKGVAVEIVYEDSAADPKVALPASQKLVSVDHVSLIIGGPGSSANVAVAPALEKAHVPFLAFSQTPRLNTAGDFVFKVLADVDGEAIRMASKMYARGVRSVGVAFDSSSDTITVAKDVFLAEFQKLGGNVVDVEGYDSKTVTDFRTLFTKLKSQKPDALYILAIDKVAGAAVKQARELGLTQPIYGWSPFESAIFFEVGGSATEGVIITALPFSCENGASLVVDYCKEYRKTYSGRTPLEYSAVAYDLLSILAGVNQGKQASYGDAARAALTSRTYTGISGELVFDTEGNIRDKDFVFRIAKDGKFVDLK